MKQQSTHNYFYSLVLILIMSLGLSFQIKASLGQSIFNTLAVTLSSLSNLKVGTIINILNICFWFSSVPIRKSRPNTSDLLQIFAVLLNGIFINLFINNILSMLVLDTYVPNLALFVIGILLTSSSLGLLIAIGVVKFPFESLCLEIEEKYYLSFTRIRFGFDILFIIIIAFMTLFFKTPLVLREGTLISLLCLSKLIGVFYEKSKKALSKA